MVVGKTGRRQVLRASLLGSLAALTGCRPRREDVIVAGDATAVDALGIDDVAAAERLGIFTFRVLVHSLSGRAEAGYRISDNLRWSVGTRLFAGRFLMDATSPTIPVGGTGSSGTRISTDVREPFAAPVLYTTLAIRAGPLTAPREPWILLDLDQTHIVTLIGVYGLPRGWEVGARFRLVSGNPFTPVTGSIYEVPDNEYIAIDGLTNSARVEAFHQLDLRSDRKFTWKRAA